MELEIKGLKISQKLALMLLVTALSAMSVIGFIYHQKSQETMGTLVEKHINLIGSQLSSQLLNAVKQTNERIALISSRTQLRLSLLNLNENNGIETSKKILNIINDAKKSISDIKFIGVYDMDENLIAATASDPIYTTIAEGRSSSINFIKNIDNEPIVHTFVPLMFKNKVIGFVKILFDFELFGEVLIYKGDGGVIEKYDATLIILNNTEPEKIIFWENKFKLTEVIELDTVILESLTKPKFREITIDGLNYFSNTFIVSNASANLALFYKVDKATAFALITQQTIFLSYSIIVLILIIVAVAYFTGKRISKPVVNMAFVAHHIAEGDLGKRIEEIGTDELGVLGRTLNLMAANLSLANTNLENRVKSKTQELVNANEDLLALSKKLEKLSQTDELTTLANRRSFNHTYHKEYHRALRSKLPLTTMMLDVDCFKKFNDCYGHDAGDKCLQKVAQSLKAVASRSSDLVTRYGGEEFVILCPDTDHNAAKLLAEQLLSQIYALQIPNKDSTVAPFLTISIGVVTGVPVKHQGEVEYLKKADEALYESKRGGRNKYTSIIL